MKYLLVKYDEQTANDGGPIDMLDYLSNELDSGHIVTELTEVTEADLPEDLK